MREGLGGLVQGGGRLQQRLVQLGVRGRGEISSISAAFLPSLGRRVMEESGRGGQGGAAVGSPSLGHHVGRDGGPGVVDLDGNDGLHLLAEVAGGW